MSLMDELRRLAAEQEPKPPIECRITIAFVPARDGKPASECPVVVMDAGKGGLADPATARTLTRSEYEAEFADSIHVTPHRDDAPPVTAAPEAPATTPPAAPERLAETLPAAPEPK